jgi:hypothetical protein
MKLVTAIIKPFKLDEVREALSATLSCIGVLNTWLISCLRSRSKPLFHPIKLNV